MTQFWRVEIHRYSDATTETFATVSGSVGSHRLRISNFSFSPRSLTLHFYPSMGELVFRNGSVFLGGLQLEKVNGYQLTSPADALVTARLDIAIANIEETVLPTQYFRGVPVRAETHCYDFLVQDGSVNPTEPLRTENLPGIERSETRNFVAIEAINTGESLEIVQGRFVRRSQTSIIAYANESIPVGAFVEISGRCARVAQGVPNEFSHYPRLLQFDDRYGRITASTDELVYMGRVIYEDSRSPKICQNCRNYHGQSYNGNFLVCGIHPYGNGEDCSDFEGKES